MMSEPYFYSPSTGGFYLVSLHGEGMPSDVVEITAEAHAELMKSHSLGQVIRVGTDGHPEAGEPEKLPVDLAAYTRHVSWQKRTSGTIIDGVATPTDADTLTLINGMANLAQQQPDRIFNFDTLAGPITLNAEEAIAFASEVGAFVQLTFDRRAEVLTKIGTGDITTTEQIDAAFAEL
jgi:hypothetical protein